LHLQHLGAHMRQQHGGEGPVEHMGQVENADPAEWSGHWHCLPAGMVQMARNCGMATAPASRNSTATRWPTATASTGSASPVPVTLASAPPSSATCATI